MKIFFKKYQATGNDFVLLDWNPDLNLHLTEKVIHRMCDRRFGIGADGLILVKYKEGQRPEMIYYNSDGRIGSFCGNGSRAFAKYLYDAGKIRDNEWFEFKAYDGLHKARIRNKNSSFIDLVMSDVCQIQTDGESYILDSGSPHYVCWKNDLENVDVVQEGRKIRYSAPFKEKGINVNFVSEVTSHNILKVKTYERGVEDMTYSCGTGVVASVIAWAVKNNIKQGKKSVQVPGGSLEVSFDYLNNCFTNIILSGPAEKCFEGIYELQIP